MNAVLSALLLPVSAMLVAAMARQIGRLSLRAGAVAAITRSLAGLAALFRETGLSLMRAEIAARRLADP